MLRWCSVQLQAKSLHAMLNRFKVAGAHPDILAAVDPAKASHNGQALIQLEQLLQKRAVPATTTEKRTRDETHRLSFWFKDGGRGGAKDTLPFLRAPPRMRLGTEAELPAEGEGDKLRCIEVSLTPFAPDTIVKQQLAALFSGAGISDDFVLPKTIASADVQSVLDDVREKHEDHVRVTQPLAVRGERSVRFLRSIGVILTLDDRGVTYLLTLPERFDAPNSAAIDPNGNSEQAQETRAFLQQRNMVAFDFRMGGSYSSVEHIVLSIERLERLYLEHKGTCMQPGVCICITLAGERCHITDDGCIVLPALAPHRWEEFLLTLPQAKWREVVRLNKEWRADNPTKLMDLKARRSRLADALHFHTVVLEDTDVSGKAWQDAFLSTMLREETALRKTVEKYKAQLRIDTLKNRGHIVVKPKLWLKGFKTAESKADVEVPFRLTSDGRIHVSAAMATPVSLLKYLRDHNVEQGKRVAAYDTAMAQLESLSRSTYVEITVDPEWRDKAPDVSKCIQHFVKTAKPISGLIAAKCKSEKRGLLLLVSDRYHITPSGKALVPWDIDVSALQTAMIGR